LKGGSGKGVDWSPKLKRRGESLCEWGMSEHGDGGREALSVYVPPPNYGGWEVQVKGIWLRRSMDAA